MIVYVESNFILEIAREQEQVAYARAILDLAESGRIELSFPGFALSEPFSTVLHRGAERNTLYSSLERTLKELQRSEPYKQIMLDLEPVVSVLKDAYVRELDLLHTTCDRLLSVSRLIEIDGNSFRQAKVYQGQFSLSPQDSIIYSTVIADLQRKPHDEVKCLLSRDMNAFAFNPRIKSELALYNCRYIGSFADGLSFIERFA